MLGTGDLDVNDVTALMHDSEGRLWIGIRVGDVVRRDLERMTDVRYLQGGIRGTPRIVLGVARDHDERIWVATNGGLIRLGPEPGTEVFYTHDPHDPSSLGPRSAKRFGRCARRIWRQRGDCPPRPDWGCRCCFPVQPFCC